MKQTARHGGGFHADASAALTGRVAAEEAKGEGVVITDYSGRNHPNIANVIAGVIRVSAG